VERRADVVGDVVSSCECREVCGWVGLFFRGADVRLVCI